MQKIILSNIINNETTTIERDELLVSVDGKVTICKSMTKSWDKVSMTLIKKVECGFNNVVEGQELVNAVLNSTVAHDLAKRIKTVLRIEG